MTKKDFGNMLPQFERQSSRNMESLKETLKVSFDKKDIVNDSIISEIGS